jgi:hypothetical protein
MKCDRRMIRLKSSFRLRAYTFNLQNSRFLTLMAQGISCHKHRFKHFNFQYIYLISYRNEKKANLVKWICPFLKTISQLFNQSQNLEYIAETCNSALRTGVDDITGFLSLYFLPISWSYHKYETIGDSTF